MGTAPRQQLLQIESGADAPLIDVPDLLAGSAARIRIDFGNIRAGKVNTCAGQKGSAASPLARQRCRGLRLATGR